MKLTPQLGQLERIASVVIGAGLLAYAILGDQERAWPRGLLILLGVSFLLGGASGT